MSNPELHAYFKVEVDKNAVSIGISGSPNFEPDEIDYYLYSAYLSTIATKATGNNYIQTPFEGNIKRIADLEMLVKTDKGLTLLGETATNKLTLNDFVSTITYGSSTQEKRMYPISGILHFGSNQMNATIKFINHNQANRFLRTYNNRPWIEEPVAIMEENKLIVYVDTDLMTGPYTLDLTYLAYPRKINYEELTSGMDEIPEYMQYEVIKLAADMAIENIESPRTQTHPRFVATNE